MSKRLQVSVLTIAALGMAVPAAPVTTGVSTLVSAYPAAVVNGPGGDQGDDTSGQGGMGEDSTKTTNVCITCWPM